MTARVLRLPLACLLVLACAGRLPPAPSLDPAASEEAVEGWRAMADGRGDAARTAFTRRVAASGEERSDTAGHPVAVDALSLLGLLELDYLSGHDAAAAEEALRLLDAATTEGASGWARLSAMPAVIRLGRMLDELGSERAATEDRALTTPRASLPWPAQLALARMGDRVADRRGDVSLRESLATRAGCLKRAAAVGSLGRLPRLDLERPAPATAGRLRVLRDEGCVVEIRPAGDRPSAELLRVDMEVPADGEYVVVVAYPGELRLSMDGGPLVGSGDAVDAPARQLAVSYHLSAGRHVLDVRVAALGGQGQLTALVTGRAGTVRFAPPSGPPSARPAAGRRITVLDAVPVAAAQAPVALPVTLARALAASEAGEVRLALELQAALATGAPRSAAGLHAAAEIALRDPTRPIGLARDASRGLLRAASAADPSLARLWEELALADMDEERQREAVEHAAHAAAVAPRWWPGLVVHARALRARGLEHDADRVLDRARDTGGEACTLLDELLRRAERRRELALVGELARRLRACDAESDAWSDWLRDTGDLAGAEGELRRRLVVSPGDEALRAELAAVLLAAGKAGQAVRELSSLVQLSPRDAGLRVRLTDALVATGDHEGARAAVEAALQARADAAEVRRAARALNAPLPLDAYRLDGRDVIRAFEASGRKYDAPAVMVLDRTVVRVMPDGTQLVLTHNIVRVQSKDGVERWGEVSLPAGSEVLTLRTHKADGSTREPEEIAGKDSVSAPDLGIADYVEWETLEAREAPDAFPGGFLGDRFYFQSFDAPLQTSELLLVTPADMPLDLDRRAGAPAAVRAPGPEGTVLTTLRATSMPQLFAERSAVSAEEYVPSARASSRITWPAWTRFVREQLVGSTRWSPELHRVANQLRAEVARSNASVASGDHRDRALAAALVRWVTSKIEASDDLRDPAGHTLARGRGNRVSVALALARELGLQARPVLARPRTAAPDDEAPAPVDLEDLSDMLVQIDLADGRTWTDLRLRRAAFGYLPPSLDGARVLSLDDASFDRCRGQSGDRRDVALTVQLDARGGAMMQVRETLQGWPALELAELQEQVGADAEKLKREFEQRWVAVQFPGASLGELRWGGPATDGNLSVHYDLRLARLGSFEQQGGTRRLTIAPSFLRSQPGRRYAAEPRRRTALLLGYDVPVHIDASIELPAGARWVVHGRQRSEVRQRGGGEAAYQFVEERAPDSPSRLRLRRDSRLPLQRIAPAMYDDVATDLRQVDAMERHELVSEWPAKERS